MRERLRTLTLVAALAPGIFAAQPAHGSSGGPDTFGYTWKDSQESGVSLEAYIVSNDLMSTVPVLAG